MRALASVGLQKVRGGSWAACKQRASRTISVGRVLALDGEQTAIARSLEPEARCAGRRAARQAVACENDWDRLTGKIARIMAEGLGPEIVERFDAPQAREPGA